MEINHEYESDRWKHIFNNAFLYPYYIYSDLIGILGTLLSGNSLSDF